MSTNVARQALRWGWDRLSKVSSGTDRQGMHCVWLGKVWCGAVWCGTTRRGMHCGLARQGKARRGGVGCSEAR